MQLNHDASANRSRLADPVAARAGAHHRTLVAANDEHCVLGGAAGSGCTGVIVGVVRCGGHASAVREFDLIMRRFVADRFHLPQANRDISCKEEVNLLVGTDFGDGPMTDSTDPRLITQWPPETPPEAAEAVFSACATEMSVPTFVSRYSRFARTDIHRRLKVCT